MTRLGVARKPTKGHRNGNLRSNGSLQERTRCAIHRHRSLFLPFRPLRKTLVALSSATGPRSLLVVPSLTHRTHQRSGQRRARERDRAEVRGRQRGETKWVRGGKAERFFGVLLIRDTAYIYLPSSARDVRLSSSYYLHWNPD